MASKFAIRNVFSQIQKRFLQSSATLTSNSPLPYIGTSSSSSSSFTVQFLVESCGLPLKSALSISQKFQLDETNLEKPQSVLQLLKSHQFSDSQVAKLIVQYPRILHIKIKGNLQPKLDYLVENGLAGELLPKVVLSNPNVIHRSLDSYIKPCVEFIRSFLHSNEKVLTAILRNPWFFGANLDGNLRSNVVFFMKAGVPTHGIGKLILVGRVLSQSPHSIVDGVNAVKNLGIEPNSPMFAHALKVRISLRGSAWENKIGLMKSMGWNEEEILKAFNRFPYCLSFTEAKIRKALHFYLDTMNLGHKTIVEYPTLLGFSIEKRIRPRFNVLNALKSKKLIASKILLQPLLITEKNFRKKFVDKYIPEVPGLLEMYLGSKESKMINP